MTISIALCGDSILDNAAYISAGEPDVTTQVKSCLGGGADATLIARDGSMLPDVVGQLSELSPETTHLFISAGGNDALNHVDLFWQEAETVASALMQLANVRELFQARYSAMLEAALKTNLPLGVCTIYYPRFSDTDLERVSSYMEGWADGSMLQSIVMAALPVFNDVITHAAIASGIPLIDLRVLCNEKEDFANPIEPSCRGGEKIARKISEVVRSHDFSQNRTCVYS